MMLPYKKLTLVLAVSAILTGCGGGSDTTPPQNVVQNPGNGSDRVSEPSPPSNDISTHTVTVIGSWQDVQVFMDTSADGVLQTDEPADISNAQGKAVLDITEIPNADSAFILANITAVNRKNRNSVLSSSDNLLLKAPPLSETISIFTTVISDLMQKDAMTLSQATSFLEAQLGINTLDLALDFNQSTNAQYQAIANALLKAYLQQEDADSQLQSAKQVLEAIHTWRNEQTEPDWRQLEVSFNNGHWQVTVPNLGGVATDQVELWGEIPAPADPEGYIEGWKNEDNDTAIILTTQEVTEQPIVFSFDAINSTLSQAGEAYTLQLSELGYPRHQQGKTLLAYQYTAMSVEEDKLEISRVVKSLDLDINAPNYQEVKTQSLIDKTFWYGEYQVEIYSIELLQTWLDKPWAIVHVVYDTTPNDADDSAYSDGYIVMRLADNALEQPPGLNEGIIYRQTSSVSQRGKTQLKLVDGNTNTAWYDLGDLQAKRINQGSYPIDTMTLDASAVDGDGNQTWCFEANDRALCQFYTASSDTWQAPFLLSPNLPSGQLLRTKFVSLDYNSEGVLGVLTNGWDTHTAVGQYYPQSDTWQWQEGVDFYNIHNTGDMQLDNASNWVVKLGDNLNTVPLQTEHAVMLEDTDTRLAPMLFDSGVGIYIGSNIYKTQRGQIYILSPKD